mmetsp:Transcript_11296/g.25184  ORF Transcript_11296/g.25184 Transcript_11296/m.25184 type:complete len:91 (-) Transcript_11296:270-542(-)
MGSVLSRQPTEEPPSSGLIALSEEQLAELKQLGLPTPVATLEDNPTLYAKLRTKVWNLDHVGWPWVIVQPQTPDQVAAIVKFAQTHKLQV